jgi:arsenate reductase
LDLILYGLKTCDTCRKAQKALSAAGHSLTVIDVRSDGMPRAELVRFLSLFGDDLVHRRSTTWRGLSDVERERDALDLLTEHPTLMKRPLVVAGDAAYLGWGRDVQSALAP